MSINWESTKCVSRIEWIVGIYSYEHNCSIPNRFVSRTNQPFDIIHGFGYKEFNAGVVRKPPVYTWEITIPANSDSIRAFRALMVGQQQFSMTIEENDLEVTIPTQTRQFQLISEKYLKSYVVSMDNSYVATELPMIVINGVSYDYKFEVLKADKVSETDFPSADNLGDGTATNSSFSIEDIFVEWNKPETPTGG